MNVLSILLNFPNDSGPIYKETVEGRFPVEPFNTLSNFLFLAIIIYFSLKVYKDYKKHSFLAGALPVLSIGFIGGTIYHATRSHEIWLLMDWVPIILLCLAVSIYFTLKDGNNWLQKIWLLLLVLVLVFGVRFINWPAKLKISIGYIATALGLLLPLVIYLIKTNFKNGSQILYAVSAFSLAILFRILDKRLDLLEMGTHWLWHSFGAIAVFFLMNYIFLIKKSIR
ncbi:hypothetical protein [Mesonia maritima]|uniref:Hemolysin III n=1 Tax=Mesonia maritima TaxID=1793873 RepID=A0ABU1K203_9FLAO|nr:hypothetical protein [Mesonia maritima]MDR6299649.1 hemolysin III [Mesonia maritima]